MKTLKLISFTLLALAIFSSCQKEVSLEGGNITLAGGTWKFQQGTVQYNGNVDSSFIQSSGATKILTVVGKSINGQENFSIRLFATDSFTTGSYSATLSQSEFKYFTAAKTIYQGDFLTGQFTVTIISLANNSIAANFSGQVEDSTGNVTQITLGTFVSTINLSGNGGGGGGTVTSVGTLGNTAGACTPVTPSGNYVQGTALTASNTVLLQVNVTTPGTYIIATNSVNGVNFFKSGTFLSAGVQNITLDGAGTPLNAGVQNYTVTFGTSNCTFPITFLPGVVILDYFPITLNSLWAYSLEGGTSSDSILAQVNSYTKTIGGNLYTAFLTDGIPPSGSADTTYFRKSGSDYFTNMDVQIYYQFDNPVKADYIFLKDNVPAGTSYKASADFSGTVSGAAVSGFIQATITEKGVPVTIGSLDFSDVIKVTYEYFYTALPGVPIITEDRWYARGVGLIYDNIEGFVVFDIGRYTVL